MLKMHLRMLLKNHIEHSLQFYRLDIRQGKWMDLNYCIKSNYIRHKKFRLLRMLRHHWCIRNIYHSWTRMHVGLQYVNSVREFHMINTILIYILRL